MEILEPLAGVLVEGTELHVRWHASDPDGDKLTYFAGLSTNGGASYFLFARGLHETEFRRSLKQVAGSDRTMIQVHASDGLATTTATAGPFKIPKRGPEIFISNPMEGEAFYGNDLISFDVDIFDSEGPYPYSRKDIVWRSNIDGDLCRGEMCSVTVNRWLKCVGKRCAHTRLKRGMHTVTVSVTGRDDMTTEATVQIEVQ